MFANTPTLSLMVWLVVPVLAAPARAEPPEPVKVTVQLRGAIGEGSVKALREALAKVEGIKFNAEDIVKGSEPRFVTEPFVVEILRPDEVTIGAIAKAVAGAKTPLRDELAPGLHLVLHSLDAVMEPQIVKVRDALGDVKGLAVRERGGVGGSPANGTIWIRLDDSGEAKLEPILEKLRGAGIKVVLNRSP